MDVEQEPSVDDLLGAAEFLGHPKGSGPPSVRPATATAQGQEPSVDDLLGGAEFLSCPDGSGSPSVRPPTVTAQEEDAAVDELLGTPTLPVQDQACSSGGSSSSAAPAAVPKKAATDAAAQGGDTDIPEPKGGLPPEVDLQPTSLAAYFKLQCQVDVQKVLLGARNAELNPRRHHALILRLVEPRVAALVFPCGAVHLSHMKGADEELARRAARRITCIVQKCGHPEARCSSFRISRRTARAHLPFPVRLDRLALKWKRHALYEPEISPNLFFSVKSPRCTITVTKTGKLLFNGFATMQDAEEALRKTYAIFREFSR